MNAFQRFACDNIRQTSLFDINSLFDSMVAECYNVPDRIGGTHDFGTKLATQSAESSLPILSTKEFATNYVVKVKDPDIRTKNVEINYFSASNQLVVRIIEPTTRHINKYTSTITFNHCVDATGITASKNKSGVKILVPKLLRCKTTENQAILDVSPRMSNADNSCKLTNAKHSTKGAKNKWTPPKVQRHSSIAKDADTGSQFT
jgi:HSP20 family molecular chaperone IbpA